MQQAMTSVRLRVYGHVCMRCCMPIKHVNAEGFYVHVCRQYS
jgi:hypothetical protein